MRRDQRRLPGSGGTRARAGKKQEGRGGYCWQKGWHEPRPRGGKNLCCFNSGSCLCVGHPPGMFSHSKRPWEAEAEVPLLQLKASDHYDRYKCLGTHSWGQKSQKGWFRGFSRGCLKSLRRQPTQPRLKLRGFRGDLIHFPSWTICVSAWTTGNQGEITPCGVGLPRE